MDDFLVHLYFSMVQVIGKCYVLPLVDYIKMAPENVDEKDVFVCESRYNSRSRFFKKIKVSLLLSLLHSVVFLDFS